MDLWLIAATAATGYIAKHLPNVTRSKDNILESSSEDVQNVKPEPPRCLLGLKKPKENKFGDGKVLSDVEKPDELGRESDYRVDFDGIHSSVENSGNFDGIYSDSLFSTLAGNNSQLSYCKGSVRNITFIRRNRNQRYRLLTKSLSSSCRMSQFHREQMTMEDYMILSPHVSFSRPLLVTDGARVINNNTVDSLWLSQHYYKEDKAAQDYEIPVSELSLVDSITRKVLHIGILIGIVFSFMATQTEVNKVKESLKQTENLANDLQDELDKENVKECEEDSLEDVESRCKEKVAENLESISTIEAELEAELEKLETNMNSSNIELEPNFEVEFAQGEFRADKVKERCLDETESCQDQSGNLTPESGNCGVSARELSLRLHEVINSQLVERIKELETALQESQRKVEQVVMESERKKHSWSKLWQNHEIKQTETNLDKTQQPLVMNLTGEALDAFNESYDELMKVSDDSEDDESPLEIQESERQEKLYSTSKSSPWSHLKDSSMVSEDLNFREQELLDEEENSEFEREMEKLLIKQIVEKKKQGSSVGLNAQKMLLLMEETDQNR